MSSVGDVSEPFALHAQVPLLPVFSDAVLHTAAFLSQNLPPILDTIVPPTYVRQV